MTLSEFNAWLDGYSEHIERAPTAEQWRKIRTKLAECREGAPVNRTYRDGDLIPITPRPRPERAEHMTEADRPRVSMDSDDRKYCNVGRR